MWGFSRLAARHSALLVADSTLACSERGIATQADGLLLQRCNAAGSTAIQTAADTFTVPQLRPQEMQSVLVPYL
jgi:hypothetical protein